MSLLFGGAIVPFGANRAHAGHRLKLRGICGVVEAVSCGSSCAGRDQFAIVSASTRILGVARPARRRAPRRCRSARPGRRAASSSSNKARAAALVQMGRDLVQQQERRAAPRSAAMQPGLRQHDGDQQRLLLAGRAVGGGHAACPDAMATRRSLRCGPRWAPPASASSGAAGASVARSRSSAASAGISPSQLSTSPCERQPRRGKRPSRRGQHGGRAGRPGRAGRRRWRRRCSAICCSSAASQAGSRRARGSRPAAGARARAAPARRRERGSAWPGSKPSTSRSRKRRRAEAAFDEQPVHLRRQPEHRQDARPGPTGPRGERAVDAHQAAVAAAPRRRDRGRCRCRISPPAGRERRGHGPGGRGAGSAVGAGACGRSRASRAWRRPRPGAEEGDAPPADWSCRRRWGRSAPPAAGPCIQRAARIAAEIGQRQPGAQAHADGRPARQRSDRTSAGSRSWRRGEDVRHQAACAITPASASAHRARWRPPASPHQGRRGGVGQLELRASRPRSAR